MNCRRVAPLSLALVATVASAQGDNGDPSRELDAYVARAVREWNVAGFAIAVVKDGRVVFSRAYGVRDVRSGEPVDTSTLFAIASTTKALTAAAIGMLVDEGRVRWDDPVIMHLPAFRMFDPYVTREVSVRDLLSHRAGLPGSDYLWTGGDNTRDEIVRRVRFIEPAYSLRGGYTYQNVMYLVAGRMLEAVSGMTWDDFIATRILTPLGMSRTVTTLAQAATKPNVAAPHWNRGDTLVAISNSLADGIGPAGSVWSSVADMSKWVRFLLDSGRVNGQPLLRPNTWAELFRPNTILPPWGPNSAPQLRLSAPHFRTYALGWFQQDYQGKQVDFHTGSLNGMIAMHGLVRENGLGVYMLANTDHAELRHALMFKVFDLYLGLPSRDWSGDMLAMARAAEARTDSARARNAAAPNAESRPALELSAYTGTFVDSLYGTAIVTMENGSLRLRVSSHQAATLEHWQYESFRARWDDWWRGRSTVSFIVGPNGQADRLELAGFTLRRARTMPARR
ncbi:MAG TPA: serine hydrolase [Gemmatimonadaceae bacterium]